MKQLSPLQVCVFIFGAIMMLIGVSLYVFATTPFLSGLLDPQLSHKIGACFYTVGAVCFATMQLTQHYNGRNFTLRRLRRMQILGDIFFLVAAVMVIENAFMLAFPWVVSHGDDWYLTYLQLVYNNWVVVLLMATILEVYTTHRIDSELKKERGK